MTINRPRSAIARALQTAGCVVTVEELARMCAVRLRRDGLPPGAFQDRILALSQSWDAEIAERCDPEWPSQGRWLVVWIPPEGFRTWLAQQRHRMEPGVHQDCSVGDLARHPKFRTMPDSQTRAAHEAHFGELLGSVWEEFLASLFNNEPLPPRPTSTR